jgi:tetratricopeptide (TPR) repeat protein
LPWAAGLILLCPFSVVLAEDAVPGKGKEEAWMNARTVADIAKIQLNSGKYDDAVNGYKSAISIYSDDPSFHWGLGAALQKANRTREAEQAYRSAVQKDSKSADGWFRLAELSSKLGNVVQADSAYSKAYELAPDRFEICFKQAINLASKDAARSSALMKRAFALAKTPKDKADVTQYMSKVSADTAPPTANAVRLFKITTQAASASSAAATGANQAIGKDGLFAYAGPAGRSISQRGLKKVLELVLIDNSNRRMRLTAQDALSLMRIGGIAGLKAKGWAGEVRPIPITDLNPQTEIGSQFVIPSPI